MTESGDVEVAIDQWDEIGQALFGLVGFEQHLFSDYIEWQRQGQTIDQADNGYLPEHRQIVLVSFEIEKAYQGLHRAFVIGLQLPRMIDVFIGEALPVETM